MNAPRRTEAVTRDEQIRASAFSPMAFSARYNIASFVTQDPGGGEARATNSPSKNKKKNKKKDEPNMKNAQNNFAPFQTAMKDYTMLAFSSARAGRHVTEGQAYFAIAVLYDNMSQYGQALPHYKKFIDAMRKAGDRVGEALGLNCMGVDCQHIACPPDEGSPFDSSETNEITLTARQLSALNRALQYHQGHLDIADDGGKFVAHTNLGLCYSILGDHVLAARHHQDALRTAIHLQSTHGQSIAVGNLGLLASRQGDLVTARACMDQHLQLVQALQDSSAECNAWHQLGLLTMAEEKHQESRDYLDQARLLAEKNGEIGILKRINCNLGIAAGTVGMEERFAQLADFAVTGYK